MPLFLTGCASTLNIHTAPVTLAPIQAPQAQPMTLGNIKWSVMNQADIKALKPGSGFVIYTLDGKNFRQLDNNILEMRRYILEQNQIIIFYKGVSDTSQHNTKTPIDTSSKKQ